jgi:hypothetical protein
MTHTHAGRALLRKQPILDALSAIGCDRADHPSEELVFAMPVGAVRCALVPADILAGTLVSSFAVSWVVVIRPLGR